MESIAAQDRRARGAGDRQNSRRRDHESALLPAAADLARLDRAHRQIAEIQPLLRDGKLAFVKGLLGRKDQRRRRGLYGRRQPLEPGQFGGHGDARPELSLQVADHLRVEPERRETTLLVNSRPRERLGGMGDAAHGRFGPSRRAIGPRPQRKIRDAEVGERTPRAEPSRGEFLHALGNRPRDARRFLGMQERGVAG